MRNHRNLALSVLTGMVVMSGAALLGARYANGQTFAATGSMAAPLICSTVTPLPNGTILIAGGDNANGPTTAAEIYNPSSGEFTPVGAMNVAHGCFSTAALLNDGTVLIAGGSGNTTAELYISSGPSSGSFSLYTPPTPLQPQNPNGTKMGPMTAVRYHATATLLQNGTVLIAGGDTGNNAGMATAEIYNPATGTFTATGNMTTPRTTQTATRLPNGTVLIAGGQHNISGQVVLNTAEIYTPSTTNPLTGTFTAVGNLTTTRCQQTATLLTNGTVLIAGGENTSGATLSSAEIYTPSTATSGSFAATGSMNSARVNHTAILLADGTVLVTGGFPNIASSNNATGTAEIYTPSARTFALTGNMTEPRGYISAVMIYNGEILIAGGEDMDIDLSSFLSSAELYSYPVSVAYMNPAYHVTSILYAPPGNKSISGFLDTTTTSTTTSIGSSFSQGESSSSGLGFVGSVGVPPLSITVGVTASDSLGVSSTSSSTAQFQETYTDATGVSNAMTSTAPDAINHNLDEFLIWLNPQISVYGNASAPVGYTLGVVPLADGAVFPDVIQVWADNMEANAAGITEVSVSALGQQPKTFEGETVWLPGLASICKNVIEAEYNPPSGPPSTCTKADQCGCTPADFLPILQTDALLFYDGPTSPVNPYPGTVSPTQANTTTSSASDENCGKLPNSALTGADCRYVAVPETPGSEYQAQQTLYGPTSTDSGGGPGSFSQGENTTTTYTLAGQTQTTASQSLSFTDGLTGAVSSSNSSGGSSSGSGALQGSWGLGNTMTWTDMQSVGTASGSGVSQNLTLNSGTLYCQADVPIFEDTIYHTFVFEELAPVSCTTWTPAFSVTVPALPNPPPAPNCVGSCPAPPVAEGLGLGDTVSLTVDVSAWFGFKSAVALSISGLPAGVTASFSPASITTSTVGSATLTLTASSSATVGSSTITVTGTSGSETDAAVFTLVTFVPCVSTSTTQCSSPSPR